MKKLLLFALMIGLCCSVYADYDSNGVFINALTVQWDTDSNATADFSSSSYHLGGNKGFGAEVAVTEDSGTATLDIYIQGSFDGTNWHSTKYHFNQISATGRYWINVNSFPFPYARYYVDFTGTGQYDITGKICARSYSTPTVDPVPKLVFSDNAVTGGTTVAVSHSFSKEVDKIFIRNNAAVACVVDFDGTADADSGYEIPASGGTLTIDVDRCTSFSSFTGSETAANLDIQGYYYIYY